MILKCPPKCASTNNPAKFLEPCNHYTVNDISSTLKYFRSSRVGKTFIFYEKPVKTMKVLYCITFVAGQIVFPWDLTTLCVCVCIIMVVGIETLMAFFRDSVVSTPMAALDILMDSLP